MASDEVLIQTAISSWEQVINLTYARNLMAC